MPIPKASDEDKRKLKEDPGMTRDSYLKIVGEVGIAIFGSSTSGAVTWMAGTKILLGVCGKVILATNPPILAVAAATAGGGCLMYGLAKMISMGENDNEKD